MKTQEEVQNATAGCTRFASGCGFLFAGLGIGAALSVFLAPKSGAETRKWIATKCLDQVDAANTKVRQTRLRVHDLVDQGQCKVDQVVMAGREAFGAATPAPKTGPS